MHFPKIIVLILKKHLVDVFILFQLLQNLGKADKTTDEIFEEHLLNFNLQQANATRLQKDISNYIRCIKGNIWLENLQLGMI